MTLDDIVVSFSQLTIDLRTMNFSIERLQNELDFLKQRREDLRDQILNTKKKLKKELENV